MGAIEQFVEFIASDHASVIFTDPRQPENPIVGCNQRFLNLTGYSRDEVIGRNCRFLAGPLTSEEARNSIREAIEQERPAVVELINYRKDGTTFLNSLMIAPIHDPDEGLIGFVGSQIKVPGEQVVFVRKREQRARKLAGQLSRRQTEVLSLMARGMRIKLITHELGLAERTVKLHRSEMLKKLGVQTNAEAIRIAVRAMI